MSARSLDDVRFIFDEDNRGIGVALARMRPDMICMGDDLVADFLPLGCKDPDWIPIVAERGWIPITKNYRIRTQPIESQQALDKKLVIACLVPTNSDASRWELCEILFRHWRQVERIDAYDGPTWLELRDDRPYVKDFEPGRSNRLLRRSRKNVSPESGV